MRVDEKQFKVCAVAFDEEGVGARRGVAENVVLAESVKGHAVGRAVFEFHVADRLVAE